MDDPRQQHGDHTWDIIIDYVKCPHCGYILENRQKYESHPTGYERPMVCIHCKQSFTSYRNNQPDWPALIED